MRLIWCLWLLLGAGSLVGCATSSTGYQKDGTYILDQSEQGLDCQRLHQTIWGHVQTLRDLPEKARAEQQSVPVSAVAVMKRLFGGRGQGLAAVEQYERERAHVDALRRAMAEKGCTHPDLDREIDDIAANMAEVRGR